MMRKALAYFGLDGSATRKDWARAAVDVLPPIVIGAGAAWLDGVHGLAGWGLLAVYLVVAWAVWLPLLVSWAPWWRWSERTRQQAVRRRR